jgi:hypothetical protein
MKKMTLTAFLGGLVGGGLFCGFFGLIYAFSDNPFLPDPKSLDFFVYLLAVSGALVYFRFRQNGGYIGFWQGIIGGTMITVLITLIAVGFIYIFCAEIAPETVQTHINYQVKHYQTHQKEIIAKFGKANYEQTIKDFESITPLSMAMYEIWKIPVGLLITFIVAVVLRK